MKQVFFAIRRKALVKSYGKTSLFESVFSKILYVKAKRCTGVDCTAFFSAEKRRTFLGKGISGHSREKVAPECVYV